MCDFVHLHVHSEYSLLDGLGRTKDLAKEAARLGQRAIALTDHGVMHGAVEFFRNCKKNDVKPIIGLEAYMTPFGISMEEKSQNHHLLLLAENMTGYKNLLKLSSEAQLRGFYRKPRIDADLLATYSEGLICTTGCMAAEIPSLLNPENGAAPQPDKALERLRWYLDIFGRDRFFIELQEHSIPALTEINKTLFEWSKSHKIELLATNDVHYVTAADAQAHDTLLCVQTNAITTQQNRMKLSDMGYYLKSEAEMRDLFRPLTDLPDSAFTNSVKIAEMCNVNLEDESFHLPDLPDQPYEIMPKQYQSPQKDYAGFLRYLAEKGLQDRYGDEADSKRVRDRLEHELAIINRMNFAVYFLIVWDLCRFARENNIWWNVRGSGAGSIVAYAVGITLIDPLKNNLIFERFLNPGRISMPDFDLDYPDDQREHLIRYTLETYGAHRVAQIVSFGRMKARAAIRDVGRAMDMPLEQVDRIAKMIAAIPGKPVTIDNVLDPDHEFYSAELKDLYGTDAQVTQLVDFARNLEGVARHASVHAAAVIITDQPLTDYVPVMRPSGDAVITPSVTQFEFPICESIGLLKVDFLGLSTLTVMRKAAELIEARHGISYHIENIAIDDPNWQPLDPNLPPDHLRRAFELLSSGKTTGVFQVEGQGMTNMLREMRPSTFEHIVAAISLYRPGPMEYIPTYIKRMHGEEKVEYAHPLLKKILGETYNIIVYQEQIIQLASELAGYAPGDADRIRKAVGKKKKAEIDAHREKFINGTVEGGFDKKIAEKVWGDIEFFARYGFNKCLPGEVEVLNAQTGQLIRLDDLYHGRESLTQTVTCDTDCLSLTVGQVVDVLDNGVKPVYRLTTHLGHEIEATGNHPFYTFDGWRQLDELAIGERIAIPRCLPVAGDSEWPDYQVIVLGHLLAEGNLCHPHSVYYYTQNQADLDDYVTAVTQFANVDCSISLHRDTFSVYAKRIDRASVPGVVTWAQDLGIWGKTATEKEVPAAAFRLGQRQIALLLGRMWAGDGHLGKQSQADYIHAYYATSSKRLAQHVQHLLLRLGVVSRLRTATFAYKEGRIGYQVHVMGIEHSRQFAATVGRYLIKPEQQALCQTILQTTCATNAGTRDTIPLGVKALVRHEKEAAGLTWKKFRAKTGVAPREFLPTHNQGKRGFRRETIATLASYFDSEPLSRYAESDLYWDEVVSIEYVGEKQTYDLTIAETHNFVANNIIVHNSHASDYGMVTCQTAYLKANYRLEYMTALLTVERNNTDKITSLMGECRAMGIKVLPPHVNYSRIDFVIDDESQAEPAIRFGMSAIKNVGEGAIEAILEERDAGGPFKDIDDFCTRVDLRKVQRRALEGLIKVGALDCFHPNRNLLLEIIDRMLTLSSSIHKAAAAGQMSMFGMAEAESSASTGSVLNVVSQVDETPRRLMLEWEKELVGTYLSEHPIYKNIELLKAANFTMLKEISEKINKRPVRIAGVVISVRDHRTKKGDPMAFVELEDMDTSRELVVFPQVFETYKDLLAEGELLVVKGKVDAQPGRTPKVLADEISTELPQIFGGRGDNGHTDPPPPNGSGHHNGQPQNGNPRPVLAETSSVYQAKPEFDKFSQRESSVERAETNLGGREFDKLSQRESSVERVETNLSGREFKKRDINKLSQHQPSVAPAETDFYEADEDVVHLPTLGVAEEPDYFEDMPHTVGSPESSVSVATQPLPKGGELQKVPLSGGFRGAVSRKEVYLDGTKQALNSSDSKVGEGLTETAPEPVLQLQPTAPQNTFLPDDSETVSSTPPQPLGGTQHQAANSESEPSSVAKSSTTTLKGWTPAVSGEPVESDSKLVTVSDEPPVFDEAKGATIDELFAQGGTFSQTELSKLAPFLINIRLTVSGNEMMDNHKLKMVVQFLSSYEGHDRFAIHIDDVVIPFDKHTTCYSEKLRAHILRILGEDAMWLTPLQ